MTPAPAFPAAFSLAGRTALVTGGGTGLGLGIARCMAAAGARVIVAGRRREVLEEAVAALGGGAVAEPLDLADTAGLAGVAAGLLERHGTIDILVNNAGQTVKKPFLDSSLADLDAVLDVHLRGALELTRGLVGAQVAQGHGRVIFTASVTAFIGQPLVHGYTIAKTALTGAVRALSAELAASGVRVNAVAPGWIDTALFRAATANDPDRRARILGRIQTRSLGMPEDIGWACVYLAAPAGGYVTGQTLVVDGGGTIGF